MSTENPVMQLLISSGNQSILAAGSRPDALANGQLGIFNYHTGLSIDGTVLPDAMDIFFAVGINRTLGGTNAAEDINKSSGQFIQSRRATSFTVKGASDEQVKIQDITGYTPLCDSDFVLNVEFRGRRIYGLFGYNQFSKPYAYHTLPCKTLTDCADCDKTIANAAEVAKGLINIVAADPDKLVTASARVNISGVTVGAATGTGTLTITIGTSIFSVPVVSSDTGTVVAGKIVTVINGTVGGLYFASNTGAVLSVMPKTAGAIAVVTLSNAGGTAVAFSSPTTNVDTAINDIDAFALANPGVAPVIRLTGIVQTRPIFQAGLPIKYWKEGIDFITTGKGSFVSNSTVADKQAIRYREGHGTDIMFLEYQAMGWGKVGPYRTSAVTGLPKDSIEYFSVAGSKYAVISIVHPQVSSAGWLDAKSDLTTLVIVPCADSTTLSSFIGVTDLIFTQFGAMTNDLANVTCTSSGTSTFAPNVDGVESLA